MPETKFGLISMTSIWVLTNAVNDYYQYGSYFVDCWLEKPTKAQLLFCEVPENRIQHVLNGGGRFDDYENDWFYLEEIIR